MKSPENHELFYNFRRNRGFLIDLNLLNIRSEICRKPLKVLESYHLPQNTAKKQIHALSFSLIMSLKMNGLKKEEKINWHVQK